MLATKADTKLWSLKKLRERVHDRANLDCCVLVIEVLPTDDPFEPSRLKEVFEFANLPLTLVLLPRQLEHQTTAWLDAGADRCLLQESDPRIIKAMIRAMVKRV
ncbi:hypothetical protein, partial [Limnohabitans sp.]|uniref:hypothetical protein n=1 Tax=Limnohabitans sp. TaxID=1907725 RepID=UPI00311DD98C